MPDVLDDDTPFSFESPESSTIASASYDPDTQTMTVEFKRGDGKLVSYTYNPFPIELWVEFVQAVSKGGFFASRIRPLYAGKPVT